MAYPDYPMAEQASGTTTFITDAPKANGNRSREVPKAFEELAGAQKYTAELIQQLYERLGPALGPSLPQETSESPAYPKSVELASAVYNAVKAQQSFNSQLRDFLERLEI